MISVAEAGAIIQKYWPDWGAETLTLEESVGAVLGEQIQADRDYPPGNRAMMDGVALDWSRYQEGQRRFPVLGTLPAGNPPPQEDLGQGCWEVMTGAYLPPAWDLVIPYEDLRLTPEEVEVTEGRSRRRYEFIHLQGSDCRGGDVLVNPNHPLNGPIWCVLTSVGKVAVRTPQRPRIALIATGDELVAPEQAPQPYQLRRSNVYALQASLLKYGFSRLSLTHLPDDPQRIEDHYRASAANFEILLYSGAVSQGKFDYLPQIWQNLGVTRYLQGVAQRPGKPLWFGVDRENNTVILGLPGNPISSLVCLHRYLLPQLLPQAPVYARLAQEMEFKPSLTYFLPVKLESRPDGSLWADPLVPKNSGEFTALVGSDGFLELPPAPNYFSSGEAFPFYSW
ncbi:MAG: molybdopterin molybdenumtransferase MoeA [Cyanobacteria bacterium RI_101]|nr:molybdopterin molybdenumtransferase MoeA [Cyanobacteria bacterium RI_101]